MVKVPLPLDNSEEVHLSVPRQTLSFVLLIQANVAEDT